MAIKTVVIDDEPFAIEVLRKYIAGTPALHLIADFDDALSAGEFLRSHKVDLLFLDINMPDINGIDLLRSLDEKPMVVFTTAYKEFAHQGFDLDAIDYLVKPFSFERFTKAVSKAAVSLAQSKPLADGEQQVLFVRSEYKLVRIELDQIEYIENLGDYLRIHLAAQKPVMTLMTLKTIADKLPPEKFARIHRSYIIPLRGIVSIVNQKVRLQSKTELPIGDSYLDAINKWIRK